MAATEKTVSGLISRQLPDFIRADNPKFQQFVEHYYKWLENDGTFTVGANTYSYGNTVYHIMNAEKYRDIDETIDPFIRLFKEELLPYFPENTELDLTKILKGAREFYLKKGSEESLKWLFRVLFDVDIDIFYPKQQILIASDGKWKLPLAFQLSLSNANQSIVPNLLEKRKGTGSISKATCVVESANKTIDIISGGEILEIFVSNVFREFQNGENLEIIYEDENGDEQTFIEKIIGSISNIRINTSPTLSVDQNLKRRGLLYNVGDPVVVFGGLGTAATSNDAVAIVGNVTVGSVEAVTPTFPGYGYRVYSNTETIVFRSNGDDADANAETDIRVAGINVTYNVANSQESFLESITIDRASISTLESTALSAANYTIFTGNNRNIVLTVTESDANVEYNNNEKVFANGATYASANFKGIILNANSAGFGQGGSPYSGTLILYEVSNTASLTATGFLSGQTITTANTGKTFTVDSVDNVQLAANINSQLIQALDFQELETGGIAIFNVINGGFGFRSVPTIEVSSYFDTYISESYDYDTEYADKKVWRQPMGVYGQIAHVYVENGGTGYANGDAITINCGQGYGFTGYVNVSPGGIIKTTTITNRGEGYYGTKSVTITTSGGSGATLTPYGFGEGETHAAETGAIGRIRDFRILSRGFDYVSTPVVSLKVIDMVIDAISENSNLVEGEKVYQGASLTTATFTGIVKEFKRSTNTLRLFDYSGSLDATSSLVSEGGVTISVDLTARVAAPSQYPAEIIAAGLPNPWYYGNGRAKAVADFFNGLIKFPGFYLNTDGFLSADKKLQDDKTYHNFSYVIQSEKSISEYRNPVMDIVHPLGMSMLGRTLITAESSDNLSANSSVYINAANPTSSNVSVADSEANSVTGTITQFNTPPYQANVGDLFIIKDSTNELRSQAKIIKVVNNDTSLEIEGDFTFIGQGRGRIVDGEADIYVSGNTNAISSFITNNDEIRLNIATGGLYVAQTGNVQIFTANGKVIGTATQFSTEFAANDIIRINNEVRKIVNIASATVMNVNAAFSEANTGLDIEKLATIMTVNVVSLSGNVITTNTTMQVNVGNLVYMMIPDYYTDDYDYDIITVTDA